MQIHKQRFKTKFCNLIELCEWRSVAWQISDYQIYGVFSATLDTPLAPSLTVGPMQLKDSFEMVRQDTPCE